MYILGELLIKIKIKVNKKVSERTDKSNNQCTPRTSFLGAGSLGVTLRACLELRQQRVSVS